MRLYHFDLKCINVFRALPLNMCGKLFTTMTTRTVRRVTNAKSTNDIAQNVYYLYLLHIIRYISHDQ